MIGTCQQIFKREKGHNKSLKPTLTRVTHLTAKAKPAPRYGGLVPPFYFLLGIMYFINIFKS
jgi:hypothetical protein